MIRKLIVKSAVVVNIEANKLWIRRRVVISAVATPAKAPANIATGRVINGLIPETIIAEAIAAPNGKLPSTVRSGQFNTRNDINTANATRAKPKPEATAPTHTFMDSLPSNLAKTTNIIPALRMTKSHLNHGEVSVTFIV
jgi:hypothetical protein